MIVVVAMLSEIFHSKQFKRVKPVSLHVGLFVFIFVYAFVGGLIFTRIEIQATLERDAQLERQQTECVSRKLAIRHVSSQSSTNMNRTAQAILECFKTEVDIRSQWGYVTGALYGFGIVTTLGYNRIAPITTTGRLFCVLYGLLGIPVTMIIIANMGQYFNGFASLVKKKIILYQANRKRRKSVAPMEEDEVPESSAAMVGLALLAAFLIYVAIGAIMLPLLNGEFDFLNGIYHNFICLTAIDFGSLVPTRVEFLPITFLYVCFGLAMTTIAIQVGSEYMKKLHHLGQNLKHVAHTKVWFGGKTLKVRDLLHAVGKKCGVDPAVIDNMDLENIVERAVAIQEGKEPPPDTNDDLDPPTDPLKDENDNLRPLLEQVSTAERLVREPVCATLSTRDLVSVVQLKAPEPPVFDVCSFIAIDVELPDETDVEKDLGSLEPVELTNPISETVKVSEDIALPQQVHKPEPVIILEDVERVQTPSEEPKKFEEKKQKYGRDAKKLYETYQEEWERLERLGVKPAPRRKSLLAEEPRPSPSARAGSPRPADPKGGQSKIQLIASRFHRPPEPQRPSKPIGQGAVQAAKEALERRASHTPNVSPLPKRRFF